MDSALLGGEPGQRICHETLSIDLAINGALMITTSMLNPLTRPGSLGLVPKHPLHQHGINLPLPKRRPADGTGIVLGALVGALISGIALLVALAAWRYWG